MSISSSWIAFRLCIWEINEFKTFVNVTIWIEWCFDTVEISFRKCCSSWTCDIYQFTIITHCISIAIPFNWFRSNGLSSVILDRISGPNPYERFLGPSPSAISGNKIQTFYDLSWPMGAHASSPLKICIQNGIFSRRQKASSHINSWLYRFHFQFAWDIL